MGAAYFIVLERQVEGLDTGMDGKGISRSISELDAEATKLGLRPPSEFFSIDPEQASSFLEGESVDAGEMKLQPLQQFSAQDGLATVQALLVHIRANPHTFQNADHVIMDLRECERILSVAAKNGVGWHFEVDF
jgi:hypothetical protein